MLLDAQTLPGVQCREEVYFWSDSSPVILQEEPREKSVIEPWQENSQGASSSLFKNKVYSSFLVECKQNVAKATVYSPSRLAKHVQWDP